MRFLTIFFFGLFSLNLCAQSIQNLVTHISFDNSNCHVEDAAGDTSIGIFEAGDTTCGCGLVGNSRFFDGDEDWFYLYGDRIEDAFSTVDFSVSFYFKPVAGGAATQALISKKVDCTGPEAFAIRYNPITRSINVELAENATISASLSKIPAPACWYHVVVIRKGGATQLYVNNVKLGEATSPGNIRVDMRNTGTLTVGSSDCNLEDQFHGYIDELRIYTRALTLQDIEDLYLWPNQILTGLKPTGVNDEDIFLGESVSISLNESCATSFTWSPPTNVADPDQPEPTLTPTETTTYKVTMVDADNCTSSDSIRIIVHDVNTIKCGDILLPAAFTPNGEGPLENEEFGISNIFAVGELLSFQIFDRWGNLVFTTNDVRASWDGNYKGLPVNPGVFLYKITYRCEGTENVKSGSVTVIR
ncbi:MAG: gliding motility-associated C-terminal domain-containing protein [Saprospiraceae bacterium]|nr:gliding motility-associated C-terminal domain-containing protein [Saprospiraceae bacterium]